MPSLSDRSMCSFPRLCRTQPCESVCRGSKTLWMFLWSLSTVYWILNRKKRQLERRKYELFEKLVLNFTIFYCNLQESRVFFEPFEVAHVVTIVGRFLSKLWLPSFCLVIFSNLNHSYVRFVDFSH